MNLEGINHKANFLLLQEMVQILLSFGRNQLAAIQVGVMGMRFVFVKP
jgi:hypothetical protein